MSHTPAPWKFVPDCEYEVGYLFGADEKFICDFVTDPSPANARLIAAAPDLLEALKSFSDYVHVEQSSTDGAVTYSTTTINHFAFMARAAIAKATGES
jgi:hypothetical protein